MLVTCALETAAKAELRADHVVGLRVGPEVLAGSTRLKAGTATKIALNALSTAAMIGLGKCYGSRMVDVVATNAKLEARARRLIGDLSGHGTEDAERLLYDSGGRVKLAVVMGRLGVSRRDAERQLAVADGRLRKLLGPYRRRKGTTPPRSAPRP